MKLLLGTFLFALPLMGGERKDCGDEISGAAGEPGPLPWRFPPRTIPGYAGPAPDAAGSNEAKQIGHVAYIYQRLALEQTSLDIFAIAQQDRQIREMSFHLVEQRYCIGLNALTDLDEQPAFIVNAASIARIGNDKIALLFNPNHWETDPNLTFVRTASMLYVMDRLVRGRHLHDLRDEVAVSTLELLYGRSSNLPHPETDYTPRDLLEQLYSTLYGELLFMKKYGEWTRGQYPQMRTDALEDSYDEFWSEPHSYLAERLVNVLSEAGIGDGVLAQLAVRDILDTPLPADWPVPPLPEPPLP